MNGKAGFTLLEVLAAVLIFSVGSLAVASMQISAISGNNASGTMTEAGIWAADKMEELLSRDFTDAELQDTDGDGTDQDLDSDWVDDDGGNFGLEHRANPGSDGQPNNDTTDSQADFQETQGIYTISWNVAQNVTTNNTRTVNVIVRWTDRGHTRTFAIQGVKAR